MIITELSTMRHPVPVFILSFVGLWLAAKLGAMLCTRWRPLEKDGREDFSVVQGGVLTLLGLIIGFSFSMAISRYDQRKSSEEEEANAIGTEYSRIDLLPSNDADRERNLLKQYLDERIAFYQMTDFNRIDEIESHTARLQTDMWSVVRANAAAQPTPVFALVLSGMNDVINSQGYTEAAWRNRIPVAAWAMMVTIGLFGCFLIGYGSHKSSGLLTFILPFIIAIAFFLISDLDSPARGLIRTRPENLLSLAQSLK